MSAPSLRGQTAIVGVAETRYYKRAQAPDPEFALGLRAVMAAVEDAGLAIDEIDGFASYADERSDPNRLACALGLPELRFSNLHWGGGGGGGSGAVANAAAAVHAGHANYVVVYRTLAQGQYRRFGQGAQLDAVTNDQKWEVPYGVLSPAQRYAMKVRRFMHTHGVRQEALRAISLASYRHAQNNPRAVMHGRPLDEETYDASRWIVEPFHLYDCCMENDGAAAIVVTSAERARDLRQPPALILAASQGSGHRHGAPAHNAPDYATSNFKSVAKHLYEMAGVGPEDIDVAQVYENFTGGVLMSIVEHGLCEPDAVNDFFTLDNFSAPDGALPLNTSGGNLAECYMHGLELIIEAVRQLRGESPNQVADAKVALVASGPMVHPVSDLIVAKA